MGFFSGPHPPLLLHSVALVCDSPRSIEPIRLVSAIMECTITPRLCFQQQIEYFPCTGEMGKRDRQIDLLKSRQRYQALAGGNTVPALQQKRKDFPCGLQPAVRVSAC